MKTLIKQAKAASKAKDWAKAAETWGKVVQFADAPFAAYLGLAEALQHSKRFAEAVSVCKEGFRRFPDGDALNIHLAESQFMMKDYANALESFRAAGRLASDTKDGGLRHLQRMSALHKKLKLTKADIADSWQSAIGPLSQDANMCREILKSGDFFTARQKFVELLAAYKFRQPETVKAWLRSFDIAFGPNQVSEGDEIIENQSKLISGRRVMVSGMGWSGSGAVFDFLRENANITAVGREYRHIEGTSGIKNLRKNMASREEFMYAFADYFFLPLLGFGSGGSGENDAVYSKHLSLGRHSYKYAFKAQSICHRIRELLDSGTLGPELLSTISDGSLDAISVGVLGSPQQNVMFDNMIHINNIWAAPFINDLTLYCSFRDPRSNYVARVLESTRFAASLEEYVASYRKNRRAADSGLKKALAEIALKETSNTEIHVVQFEDFVMSRDYRLDLLRKAGLDPADHDEYSFFKPEVSRKNVFLHETFEDQEAIAYIERELPEYCVDLERLRNAEPR